MQIAMSFTLKTLLNYLTNDKLLDLKCTKALYCNTPRWITANQIFINCIKILREILTLFKHFMYHLTKHLQPTMQRRSKMWELQNWIAKLACDYSFEEERNSKVLDQKFELYCHRRVLRRESKHRLRLHRANLRTTDILRVQVVKLCVVHFRYTHAHCLL